MKDELEKAQLRAAQYQHVDGTSELTFGGTFLLSAISFHLVDRLDPPDSSFLSFAPLLVIGAGAWLIDLLVQRLRRRFTYPRTGYIATLPPRPLKRSTRLVIWIGVPLLTVIFLALLFLNRSKFPAGDQASALPVLPVFFGLIFTGLWVIFGWKLALPRFYLIAAATLLVSVGLIFSGMGVYSGIAALFGALGAFLCLSGGSTLCYYLRRTSPPAEIPDER